MGPVGQYVLVASSSFASLIAGASLVHYILKPDLSLPVDPHPPHPATRDSSSKEE